MSEMKAYPLSLNGETFNALKSDYDTLLRQLITEMERREEEDATINIKVAVHMEKDQARDFQANGYDAMRDIVKPSFKHEISTVMQIKNKKNGSLGGNMELVWDRDLAQYVMRTIDNGQVTLFDKENEGETEAEKLSLPAGDSTVIDADFKEVDAEGGETASDPSPFEWLKQFVGAELKVMEAMGNYTVRTTDNKVVLSSAASEDSPFYCPVEKLEPHIGHALSCVGYGDEELVNISIECEDCNEVLFDINAPEKTANTEAGETEAVEQTGEEPTDYQYETPTDEAV